MKAIRQWRKAGQGRIATPFAAGGAFLKPSAKLDRPDLHLHFVISMVDDHTRKLCDGYGFSCHVYHPVATCKMGQTPMAVVDPHLRVDGLEDLRVVDASVFPNLISGNTNAPTTMRAKRAAE